MIPSTQKKRGRRAREGARKKTQYPMIIDEMSSLSPTCTTCLYINKLALAKKARVHVAMKMHPRRTVATHVQNSVWDLEKRPAAFSFNRRLTLSKILSHTGAIAMEEEIRNSLVA